MTILAVVDHVKTVCAWCQRVIQSGEKDAPVSHGICAECLKRFQ